MGRRSKRQEGRGKMEIGKDVGDKKCKLFSFDGRARN
jgi:hypothetical protein